MLETSGAFHTLYMAEAASEFEKELKKYRFKEVKIPVIANLTGTIVDSGVYPLEYLIASMIKPVMT